MVFAHPFLFFVQFLCNLLAFLLFFAQFLALFAHSLCVYFSSSKFCLCYFVSFFHLCSYMVQKVFHLPKSSLEPGGQLTTYMMKKVFPYTKIIFGAWRWTQDIWLISCFFFWKIEADTIIASLLLSYVFSFVAVMYFSRPTEPGKACSSLYK